MKNILKIVLLIVFAFASCEKNVEEDSLADSDVGCDESISFAQNVNPIIVNNCVECHGGSTSPDLRTYSGISSNANDIRLQVETRRMPRGGSLTNEEIQLIICWIDNGALDN